MEDSKLQKIAGEMTILEGRYKRLKEIGETTKAQGIERELEIFYKTIMENRRYE